MSTTPTNLDPQTQAYYDSLIKNCSSPPVAVRIINEKKGKGMVALQNFQKDQIIFVERPHVAIQESHNRASAHTCSNCFKFIGSLEEQLRRHEQVLDEIDREEEEDEEEEHEHGHYEKKKIEFDHIPDSDTLVCTHLESFECFNGCGEVYCSEECRFNAFSKHHKLLCVGQLDDESHPLFLFKEHAVMSNDLFLLAAQFIATIITQFESNGYNLEQAMLPFINLRKTYYWDAIDTTVNDVPREEIQEMVGQSLKYLHGAFMSYIKQIEHGEALLNLFNYEFYALLLGALENNDQSIDITSPLQLYLKELGQVKDIEKREQGWNCLSPIANRIVHMQKEDEMEEHDDDAENGEEEIIGEIDLEKALTYEPFVFPSCQGLGMFPLEATTNHSCIPNTIIKYGINNHMMMIALRDIQQGEELTHSYIEQSAPLEQRREELLSYGFVCDCAKCESESSN